MRGAGLRCAAGYGRRSSPSTPTAATTLTARRRRLDRAVTPGDSQLDVMFAGATPDLAGSAYHREGLSPATATTAPTCTGPAPRAAGIRPDRRAATRRCRRRNDADRRPRAVEPPPASAPRVPAPLWRPRAAGPSARCCASAAARRARLGSLSRASAAAACGAFGPIRWRRSPARPHPLPRLARPPPPASRRPLRAGGVGGRRRRQRVAAALGAVYRCAALADADAHPPRDPSA